MITKAILLAFFLCATQLAHASIFVAAHADDIALFMAQNAWTDVQAGDRTVFILLTASDDGHGDYLPNAVGKSYLGARRNGHERVLRYWLASGGGALDSTASALVTINGKLIERSVIGNRLTLYYLNLPDGNYDGSGYAATGNQSLAKLLSGAIRSISAVTAAAPASYSLAELQATLRSIVLQHGHGSAKLWANMLDEDAGRNPGDHADHNATGRLLASVLAAAPLQCVSVARYTSYLNANRAPNLAPAAFQYHAGSWAVLNSALIDGGNSSTWDATHNAWLGRQYLLASPSNASCSF